ncbi:MAG: glycoside hydrolase family 97 protein [Segetibacter sp.]|nr:glycoside hydrolase family 97 protein [Segetibacter sp.]
MKKAFFVAILSALALGSFAQKAKVYQVKSPDGKINVTVDATSKLSWSVTHENTHVITPSTLSLTLEGGEVLGNNMKVSNAKTTTVNTTFATPIYKKSSVTDNYNQLTLNAKNGYGVIFRAYNDGVAYRFFTNRKGELVIKSEEVNFNFDKDYNGFFPYIRDPHIGDKFETSFESLYDEIKLSQFAKDTLAFLPVLVSLYDGKKAAILEADLEDYPGMYVAANNQAANSLQSVFAPYPVKEIVNSRNLVVPERADYIAKTKGSRSFPWRVVIISTSDKELLNNDMVQKLAPASVIGDASWIKPGKVAWDWWNDWNISHVDFRAGINTPTYKYYIDFAAANNLEYIVMDEGWSETNDITKISPRIDLAEIVNYGKQKNVGVILWATWYALTQRTEEVFAQYSAMGIKGFKIDFFDRDDQKLVQSTYDIAQKAAKYKLMVDYHGFYKPTGLQRTYPNVIGFEGVRGMENVKWAPADDVPKYDVSLPFIRMISGPMDYTPGAMRNATKAIFRPVNSMPMSKGTRCHQLAMYVVYEAPIQMLSDNPTAYMKEQESTDFISKIPTVTDETVALDGKVGEYVAIARRKDKNWYVGAMSNWQPRDITIDLSFLGSGTYEAEIFQDGINADRDATDYKRIVKKVSATDKLTVHLMDGGGWAARLYPVPTLMQ